MKQLTHGSLFAGIGGFDLGFERAGFKTVWQVEKEPFCISVLRTKFPNAERYYDVLKCGHDKTHKLRPVDVLTAGFPCQDLSVAGKRAGLEGSRSGLFWEVVRILGELRPAWFVLENVPGLFSSGEGRDFAVVLNALDELGYGVAWRVLNSQFFGVAQRRRRVFIVGCFGKPCPQEVLFEPESGGRDSETGSETWPGVADETCDRIAYSIRHNDGGSDGGGHRGGSGENLVAGFLAGNSSGAGSIGYREQQSPTLKSAASGTNQVPSIIVQQAISSKWAKGSSGPAGDEHHNLVVAGTLGARDKGRGPTGDDAANGHIVIQDARGQRDKRQNGIGIQEGGPMYTLDGTSQHAVYHENISGHLTGAEHARALRSGASKSYQFVGSSDLEHKERSGQQFDAEGKVDGAVRGEPDECAETDAQRMRGAAILPQGMDSARYRALGNAVTTNVAFWIAERISNYE